MDIFNESTPDKKNIKPSINSLRHGIKHLNNKKMKINKLNFTKSMKENFSSSKDLDNAVQRELNILSNLETKYNKILSEYSTKYISFMENYNTTMINLRDCKASCYNNYPTNSDKSNERLRESCIAGCKLSGPVVVPPQNTYTRHKISGDGCDSLTYLKCANGKILGESDAFIDSQENSDANGTTLRDGCYSCGGGIGGKPKANIGNMILTNCNDVYSPWGFKNTDSESSALINACNSGKNLYKNKEEAQNLYIQYNEITNLNKKLMEHAVIIFNKINEIKKIDIGISNILKKEQDYLQEQIQLFNDRQYEMENLDLSKGQNNATITAQMEDIILKENSEQMKVFFWSSLAIISVLFTIKQMRN